jgi:hypothetical protein
MFFVAFAFCHLLGFQLLPRLKAIHLQRSQGRSLPDIIPSPSTPSRDDVGHSFQESARSAAACCVLNACWTSSL